MQTTPVGFEPTHDGVKVRCLTTWLWGNMTNKVYSAFALLFPMVANHHYGENSDVVNIVDLTLASFIEDTFSKRYALVCQFFGQGFAPCMVAYLPVLPSR